MNVSGSAQELNAFYKVVRTVRDEGVNSSFSKSRMGMIYRACLYHKPRNKFNTFSQLINNGRITVEEVLAYIVEAFIQNSEDTIFSSDFDIGDMKKTYSEKYSQESLHKSQKKFIIVHKEAKEKLGIKKTENYIQYRKVKEVKSRENFSLLFNLLSEGLVSPIFYLSFLTHFKVSRLKFVSHITEDEERYRNLINTLTLTKQYNSI